MFRVSECGNSVETTVRADILVEAMVRVTVGDISSNEFQMRDQ